jgi:PAS domain S-box-containing protein
MNTEVMNKTKLKVLMVDDQLLVLEYVSDVAAVDGSFELSCASSGAEALACVRDIDPDVILLDYAMPGMNGVETAKRLCEIDQTYQILLISAHVDSADRLSDEFTSCIAGYIDKPFTSQDLLVNIKTFGRNRRRWVEAQNELLKISKAVEQSSNIVIITDSKGDIEYVNPMFTKVTGYTPDEAIGQNPRILKSGEMPAEEYAKLWQSITSGGIWNGEFHNKKKNGGYYWEAAHISPVRDYTGRITHYMALKQDISEQKMMEAALREQQRQLVQTEKLAGIGQLAAGVAHEINNPVGYIMSNLGTMSDYAQTLRHFLNLYGQLEAALELGDAEAVTGLREEIAQLKKEDDIDFILDDMGELLAESIEGTEKVRDIVQNLKSFAHVDEARKDVADLNQCIESTLKVVWNELKYKCTVVKNYGELPCVTCNPGELNQVFMNLLVNASHAIAERGEITITTSATDKDVVISISDTGSGIDPRYMPKLFEPFFTTKGIGKGTGLGLSISHGIIQKHHGTITVESELGKGSTFTITIPQETAE